jgi:putative oxidoreductase
MTSLMRSSANAYATATKASAHLGTPALFLMRLWVAIAFWHAGVVKHDDPAGTLSLFTTEYHVPILSAHVAAFLGTWTELIVPWLLGLGIATRPVAVVLFVYNIVAVISYPDLWPNGVWHDLFGTEEFADHKIWAMMLLAVIAWGPGKLSVDALIERDFRRSMRRQGSFMSKA